MIPLEFQGSAWGLALVGLALVVGGTLWGVLFWYALGGPWLMQQLEREERLREERRS